MIDMYENDIVEIDKIIEKTMFMIDEVNETRAKHKRAPIKYALRKQLNELLNELAMVRIRLMTVEKLIGELYD